MALQALATLLSLSGLVAVLLKWFFINKKMQQTALVMQFYFTATFFLLAATDYVQGYWGFMLFMIFFGLIETYLSIDMFNKVFPTKQ